MELSIIIVNWNTKELLLDCLDSIVKSKPKTKYEIIVVDNGSTDGSVTAFQRLHFPASNFHLIKNHSNLGFAKANNQGISKARGKYILLLNSDTKVKTGSIDKLLTFAKAKGNAGVVVPKLLNSDGSVQGSVFRLPNRILAQFH